MPRSSVLVRVEIDVSAPRAPAMLCHNAYARTTSSPRRNTVSSVRRSSAREGIHHQVHGEARVVHGEELLVLRVIVPFAAVVLVAVQQHEPTISLHARQCLVNEIVTP